MRGWLGRKESAEAGGVWARSVGREMGERWGCRWEVIVIVLSRRCKVVFIVCVIIGDFLSSGMKSVLLRIKKKFNC